MAFDSIARALLAGSVGYLQGKRRREEEARERAKEDAAASLAATAAQREAQMDEVRRRFIESQIRSNDALAQSRLNPAPEVRNIDPLSQAGIDASAERERRLSEIRARYRQPPEASAAQTDQAAREEAEGLAIYNSPQISREVARLLSLGFQAARRAGSTLSPGRLTLKVYQGLRRSRPDLFRVGSQNDGEFGGVLPGAPHSAPSVTTAPTPSAPAPSSKVPITADEYQMLLEQGYPEAELQRRFEVAE